MVRSVSIYQSLLGNLALVIVLLSGAIMALTFIGSRATVERLSGVILRETIGQTEGGLRHFFAPVVRALGAGRWGGGAAPRRWRRGRHEPAARPAAARRSSAVSGDGGGRARPRAHRVPLRRSVEQPADTT